MTKTKIITIASFALFSALLPAYGQEPKMGAVSLESILKESKFAQAISKSLNDEFAPRKLDIEHQIATIRAKVSALEHDKATLSEPQLAVRQQEISELDREIRKHQRDFQADLESKKRDSIQHVLELSNKVVLRIAKDEHYDLILQNAVYSSESANLTRKVIAEMDRETQP